MTFYLTSDVVDMETTILSELISLEKEFTQIVFFYGKKELNKSKLYNAIENTCIF